MVRLNRRHLVSGWVGLGLVGSLALTAADSELLNHKQIHWWLVVHLGSREFCHHVFWLGMLTLAVSWLGLGLGIGTGGRDGVTARRLLIAGAVWAIPLFLGPAVLSGDMYSYYAQGDMLRLGINPYDHGPAALAAVHQLRVLHAVSPFWRHTAAPYGPLFVGAAAVVSAIAGSHLVLGLMLLRSLELVGVGLLAVYVPRLARNLGADPVRALWLAVISPVVLLELIGGGHNDALMAGLLVAGVTYAVERRLLVAIVLCTLATMIKLPAAAAIVLIAACQLRELPRAAELRQRVAARTRVIAPIVLSAGVVIALVGLVTTVGFSWMSGGLLSAPAKVRIAITPATAAGWTLHSVLGAGATSARSLESAFAVVAFALTAVLGLVLLRRVSYEHLPRYLGILLLASVLGGPASWPWYLSWGIALVAVDRRAQRWAILPLVIVFALFLVGPGGMVLIPITDSGYTFVAYVTLLLGFGTFLLGRRLARRPASRVAGRSVGRARAIEVVP
jgi:hypothetical protein